ncbi:phytanoyl-CoA dioxygenase family protein [Mucilaginibacter sp. RS28]|uniref:Phytanoyl-CoA dioxygenase family protein n=1 Tax=Mucilaginibacter straminoryzae TaxID=2932774 RepID=A0A9X1X4D0_9SPHI|nr:phytanoyl-CoA dioxygenase family protein [Mucilaginibacter straminoryzae]MCJ8210834.1 phytanoyl-CoA dioxygenase family protein [Mucilaginibacter straminoryzae]
MSIKHNLPWTESPFFEQELAASGLSDQDKEFVKNFATNGYVIFDPQLDDVVIEGIKNELVEAHQKYAEKNKKVHFSPHRIQDAWQFNEHVKQVAVHQPILDKLELLYRRRPIPFQTLNFDRGTQQKTHSDMIHFSSIPERFMCGVWVALEDVTEDNGPLHYYPGSHKLPFYDMADMGVKASDSLKMKNGYMNYNDYYETFIEEVTKGLGLQKEKLLIKKGQALIWAANLLHGGEVINKAGTTRHSQVSHYYFENCTYYTPLFTDMLLKKIFLRDIVDIATGQHVPNKYLGDVVNTSNPLKRRLAKMMPARLLRLYKSIKG